MATRRRKNPAYRNPQAPKDIVHTGPRKSFRVMPHASVHIEDTDGVVRKYSGRQAQLDAGVEAADAEDVYVQLTESVASYLANRGLIELELDFASEKDAEIVQLHQDNERLREEAGSAAELRARIAELEAKLAGSDELHPDEQESTDAAVDAIIAGASSNEAQGDNDAGVVGDASESSGGKSGSGPSGGQQSQAADRVPRRRRKAG